MVPMDNRANTSATSSTISELVNRENPNCAETFASLRLYGDALVPAEVSRLLHLEPADAAAKGDRMVSSSGKPRIASTARWILTTQGTLDSTDLEAHVLWLLDRLEAARVMPLTLPGVSRADVSCYWASATGNGGPDFSPETLARLAQLNLRLGFDLYFPA
jgi:ABC-type transporter Mla subunit MlaD